MLRYASKAGGLTRDRSSRAQAKLLEDKLLKLPPSRHLFPDFSQGSVDSSRVLEVSEKVKLSSQGLLPWSTAVHDLADWPGQQTKANVHLTPKKPKRPYWPATSGPHQALIHKSGNRVGGSSFGSVCVVNNPP